jgi:ketosteroid isomerase-like protein
VEVLSPGLSTSTVGYQEMRTMIKPDAAIVKNFLLCFLTDDFDGAEDLLTEDFVLREAECLPYGGDWTGKDAFRRMSKKFREVWEAHSKNDSEHVYIDGGEGVVACVAVTPVTARSTGTSMELRAAEIFTIRDQKIAKLEVFYWDTNKIVDAQGRSS